MAFSAAQLATMVGKFKILTGMSDDDAGYAADGLAVYCSSSDATAATVQVTDTTWVGVITGGTDAGTTTKTFANTTDDTLAELVATIAAVSGWEAELLGEGSANSALLNRKLATGCLLQANEQTLTYQNEEQLELLLTNALKSVETYLGRDLLSTTYNEIHSVRRATDLIRLRHPQVTSIGRVAFETVQGIRCQYTGADEVATVEVTGTSVSLVTRTGATTTSNDITFAANVTTTAIVAAINLVSGWEATTIQAFPSAYLVKQGSRNAVNQYVWLEAWEDTEFEYEADYDDGSIELSGRVSPIRGRAFVSYTAGYTDLPADLEQVVLSMAKSGFDAAKVSGGLKSERLGDYQYVMADSGSAGGVVGSLAEHSDVLMRYLRWTP